MFLYDVAVPEMGLNLTYQSTKKIPIAVRIFVEVKKHLHTGFILGEPKQVLDDSIKIKDIQGIVDERPIIQPDLWNMALYAGRVSLCGAGAALRVILPRPVIMGETFTKHLKPRIFNFDSRNFREKNFFNPIDSERFNFYFSELKPGERTLILFSQKISAKKFFESLPDELKNNALLWSSVIQKKYWDAWRDTQAGNFNLVIGTAGAIFAPFMPQKIIIEDESSPNFIIPPILNISALTLAGHRAKFLGAELITGGRQPSLKTFLRSNPEEKIFPERKNIILADIYHKKTRKEESKGIEGNIPLTFSLVKNTYRELMKGNSVMWILDRLGESSEVFCSRCGEIIKCPKCGISMTSKNDGEFLRCPICKEVRELPPKCESCGFEVLVGRRPGLETLAEIAEKYYDKVILYTNEKVRVKKNSLILTTRLGLDLCEKINPSLIAWLDLDLELSFPGYNTKFEVFNSLWDSYWRAREKREKNSERKILIQARKSGMKLARFLSQGWKNFFPVELNERQEFNFPPFGYVIELEPQKPKLREKILNSFFDAGIFVMDSGDESEPLHINAESLEPIQKVLSSINFPTKELKITLQN